MPCSNGPTRFLLVLALGSHNPQIINCDMLHSCGSKKQLSCQKIYDLFIYPSLFYLEVDKALRGEAGPRRDHRDAHHQNPALPRQTDQPAVPGQRSRAGGAAGSARRGFSVSLFSIHTAEPARSPGACLYRAHTMRTGWLECT